MISYVTFFNQFSDIFSIFQKYFFYGFSYNKICHVAFIKHTQLVNQILFDVETQRGSPKLITLIQINLENNYVQVPI